MTIVLASGCGASTPSTPSPDAAASVDTAPIAVDTTAAVDAKQDASTLPDARDTARDTFVAKDTLIEKDTTTNTDTYIPEPVKPLQINRGPGSPMTLAEGTWKVFSFETVADRLYCLSGLASGATGYVGTSPSVSPFEYMEKTDDKGFLGWTPYASGTYYVAIAATSGSVTTSFQISEGGQLITAGENTVTLSATSDTTYFFYFSVAPGHSYSVSLAGEAKNPVTLGLAPLSDRDTTGQFADPFSTTTASLPIADQPVPYESSKTSLSRNYFVSVRVKEAFALTLTVALTF